MVQWSRHSKHENPEFSETFREIVRRMSEYFDVEVYATRLNYYADGSAWKPFHHDSHAYGGRGMREDFTMGASFGESRKLSFLHPSSKETFDFPQVICHFIDFFSRKWIITKYLIEKWRHFCI